MARSRLAANRYGQHLRPSEVEDELVGAMRDLILELNARGLLKDEG